MDSHRPSARALDHDGEGMTKEQETPTLPPPPGGDAYTAETTVRHVPVELLEAIRKNKVGAVVARPPAPVSGSASSGEVASGDATRRAIWVAGLALVIAAVVAALLLLHRVGW
jgi:hypothetical protein